MDGVWWIGDWKRDGRNESSRLKRAWELKRVWELTEGRSCDFEDGRELWSAGGIQMLLNVHAALL